MLSLLAVTAAVPALGAEAIVRRGDAAVTGFSGAKVWGKVPKDVSPTDLTFSIPAAPCCACSISEKLGGPPTGALANAPTITRRRPKMSGQVFGVTLDSETATASPTST